MGAIGDSVREVTRRDSLFSNQGGEGKKGRNFKVVVRVRPMVEREHTSERCINVDSKHAITVVKADDTVDSRPTTARDRRPSLTSSRRPSTASSSRNEEQHFAYDRVFDEGIEQEDIYEQSCRPIVLSVLEGYNGTVLAYGQTGTGKTYTMEGTLDGDNRGVIPRAAVEIFDYIESDKPNLEAGNAASNSQWLVRCSFCQIYNEKISDLLRPDGNDLKIREAGDKDIFVEDLSETVVRGPHDIYKLLARGRTQRNTNSTKMNATSSRSHAVFTIIVEHSNQDPDLPDVNDVTVGKLHLVDLAGSERYGVTDVEKHQKETVEINRSLSAFGKVVLALTSRGTQHIPYRDSKLTRILQTSLGGNSLTTMITTISPMSTSILETVTTLKFANRAKSVKNVAQVNHSSDESAMLCSMQAEIRRLQAELEKQVAVPSDDVVAEVEIELEKLKEDNKKSAIEKAAIKDDLLRHKAAMAAAQRERATYQDQIRLLQNKLVAGGTTIEETDAFKTAIAKERSRLEEEHGRERRRLEEEKAAFEEERRKFNENAARILGGQSSSAAVPKRPGRPILGGAGSPKGALMRPTSASSVGPRPPPGGKPKLNFAPPRLVASRSVGDGPVSPATNETSTEISKTAPLTRDDTNGSAHAPFSPPSTELKADRESPGFSPGGRVRRGISTNQDQRLGRSSLGRERLISEETDSDGDGDADMPSGLLRRRSSAPVLRKDSGHSTSEDRMGDASEIPKSADDETAERYSRMLQHPSTGIPLSTKRIRLSTYKLSFSGNEAARWFLSHIEGIQTAQEAITFGQQMVDLGVFGHVKGNKQFTKSDSEVYQFRKMDGKGNLVRPGSATSVMSRRSTTSNLNRDGSLSRSRAWSSRQSMVSANSQSSLSLMSGVSRFPGATSVDDYQDKNCSPLHLAAAKGDISSIRLLIQEVNIDIIDSSGRTPLMYAAISNRSRMTKFLIKNGADLNYRDDLGNTCLIWAACRGCRDSIKELLKLGADVALVDNQGRTAIHWATKLRRVECLDYLLRCAYRVVVNLQDEENLSALHWATMCDHEEHVMALLGAQADVEIGDGEGRTPIHYAVSRNALTCLSIFIKHSSAAVNAPDSNGRTALHAACAEGSVEAANILLNTSGIDLNAIDNRLTTPLHWAAVCNRPELCILLLEQGARLMSRDSSGKTPLHYATEKGFMNCANVMQRFSSSQSHRERTSLRDNPSSVPAPQYDRRSSLADRTVPSRREKWNKASNPVSQPPPYQPR